MLPSRAQNLVLFSAIASAVPLSLRQSPCAPVVGDFSISIQDLYPEGVDWDPVLCKLYLSSTYNSTLVVYDPYQNTTQVIDLPGITNQSSPTYTDYHLDGIDYDYHSGNIFIAAASATAFDTTNTGNYSNANFTGPNHILKYDPRTQSVVEDVDLASAQQEFQQSTGSLTNGFQDMAQDNDGNSYAIGTFGNSIVKIPVGSTEAQLWYAPNTYNATYGFGGLFASNNTLVVSDTLAGGLVTFDTTLSTPQAVYVPLQNLPDDYRPLMADGLFAPPRYGGQIALWSDDYNGTSVYGSRDGWATATYLGLVLNDSPAANGSFATATFEMGGSVFASVEIFQFTLPVQSRPSWPFFDITAEVDGIVEQAGYEIGGS